MNHLDEDGYPTEAALGKIANWDYNDSDGWFNFIKELWHLKSWGWTEIDEIDEVLNRPVKRYYISTAGWSGNESIIFAMQENNILWHLHWYSSRRGGHYIFNVDQNEKEILT